MNISQLRAFYAVAMTGSITRASEQLCRVPSIITTRIHQLESELGQELFIRHKNRLDISAAGRRLLDNAEQILTLIDQTELSMKGFGQEERISLGALSEVLETFLPTVIGNFRALHPNVKISVRQAPSEILRDELIKGKLDVIVNDGPVILPGIKSQHALRDSLVLITDAEYRDIHTARDLGDLDIYGFREDCSYRLKLDQWLREGGYLSPNIIEVESYTVILACVSGGLGAAWMPKRILEKLGNPHEIKIHDLGKYGDTDTYFSWRTAGTSPSVQALIDAMSKAFDQTD